MPVIVAGVKEGVAIKLEVNISELYYWFGSNTLKVKLLVEADVMTAQPFFTPAQRKRVKVGSLAELVVTVKSVSLIVKWVVFVLYDTAASWVEVLV